MLEKRSFSTELRPARAAFWEWCIRTVQSRHPEAVFLAEAFTRPKLTYALAKAGFSQSYTSFTWRPTKHELTHYLEELTRTEDVEEGVRAFLEKRRPHWSDR